MKTYGDVSLEHGKFILRQVPPHVRVLLKRVFLSVMREERNAITLSATESHARELEWVGLRFPFAWQNGSSEALEALSAAHRAREERVYALVSGAAVAKPAKLALPLRPYQLVGAAVSYVSPGLLLADEVGLGKTATSIGVAAKKNGHPALVVCLTHLPSQWDAEFKKFAPGLRTFKVPLGEPKRIDTFGVMPDVVICPYSRLSKWEKMLAGKFKTLIVDEVQELRRCDSNKYRAATSIAAGCERRLGLSATPVYNYGGEMYWIMNVLTPGLLGSYDEFAREWCESWSIGTKTRVRDPEALRAFLVDQGVFLRRTAVEVGRELPKLQVIPWEVETNDDIFEGEEKELEALAIAIVNRSGATRIDRMRYAGEFDMRMRQATGIAKAPLVAGLVRMLIESGEPVVLYGWHKAVYKLWAGLFEDLKPAFFTGSETAAEKERAKADFVEGHTDLLIISLRAGAGLDGLQHRCRTVVFGELDWSPGIHHQCVGRILRDGQMKSVSAYYTIAENGSDPVVCDVLDVKKAQANALIEKDGKPDAKTEVDPNHVRTLAAAWLAKRGVKTRKKRIVLEE